MNPSKLETALLNARTIDPRSEWEVDILRSILRGELGTQAQRASLIRLISQHKARKPALTTWAAISPTFYNELRRTSYSGERAF